MDGQEGDIPNGWCFASLNDVAHHHSGNSKLIKGKLSAKPGPGLSPAFSATGQDVWRDGFEQEGKAIIISAVGARCGKCFRANGKWSAIANTHIVWPESDLADRDFLWFKLNNENFWVKGGSAQPFVKTRASFQHRFALPPLNEQRRIVEKIETLFARLDKGEEALRDVQKLLARYRQSVLKAAVTGQLTGSNPARWEPVTLGNLLEDIRYGTAKKCRPEVEGVAVLRIPNVANGEIDLQDLKYTQLDDREIRTLGLRKGDLLVVRSNGSANLVGRGAVVNDDAVGFAFAGYLIRLRVDHRQLLPDFLQLILSSPVVRARVERQARSTSGVHNINSGEVKAISFDLPPLDVQAEIVELVDEHMAKIGDLVAWCQTELARSTALRQSILKDAFSGRLVPQDPTDESAAALLARIKQTRAAAPEKKIGKARA